MNNIVKIFSKNKQVQKFLTELNDTKYTYLVNNIALNQNYLLTYLSFLQKNEVVFYVANNLYKANLAYDTLCRLAGFDNVNLWVVDELVSSELLAVSGDFKHERINTLKSLIANDKKIIVTHTQALLKPLISKQKYQESILNINTGKVLNLKEVTKHLINIGYKKTPTTSSTGDFSIRGEVVDIFSPFYQSPIRINLFDDEIETIKFFDPITQKSIEKIGHAEIFPVNELIYSDEEVKIAKNNILEDGQNLPIVNDAILDLENHSNDERLNKYIKYITNEYCSILDYSNNALAFFDDFQRIEESFTQLSLDLSNYLESLKLSKKLDLLYFLDFYYIFNHVDKQIFLSEFRKSLPNIKLDNMFTINGYQVIDYQNDIKNLVNDLKTNNKKTFVFCLSTEERLNLVKEILEHNDLDSIVINNFDECKVNSINLIKSENAISFGFLEDSLEVLTEKEIFKELKYKKTKYRSTYQNTVSISSKEDLQIGDYVVHYDYGIAKYKGIKTVSVRDVRNDYIVLQYENMELYIPVEKITLLEKYQGSEGVVPKLTKLGTNEWDKKKSKIKEKLENIAHDLINVQIERESNKGYKYPKDNEFQKMFEEDFIFDETPDQLKAINEIKLDMEAGLVIDRLVCGDVGYGKTEIAMRAACKTVLGGKQVAYLAPTTILTRQHYYSFKDRFEKFGIRVELINRLVTIKEQNRIIKDLVAGKVDIIIGTHRLLSNDVKFKDLGLLIVDEEQRFGVIHKEAIKKMKTNINVLTLTATPIPRTLQMSIMGVRQLSLIETPPQDRYPIQTYVIEENDVVIKEAIYRELSRGGQVFYLHNRVSDLDRLSRKIRRLVPEAKIIIAHGQMNKENLEDAIQAFIDHEYDVLLCTTIIETGIDIPNTNTLIIDHADRLGLSQIYQIRGRVGRSDKVAYAYLMYGENKVLTDAGSKRLSAIKEFTNLGSGYKIAVRDLAIRGAGDILGKEQSGFIDSIGLDMYMKMLEEAIKKAKGIEEKPEKKYNIDVSKHVDENYVSDDNIKILIHKEISSISSKEDKLKLIDDFTDRFGKLNEEILLYIEESYLEVLLKKFQISSVLETANFATIVFSKEISLQLKPDKLFMKAYDISDRFSFEYKGNQIILKVSKESKDKSWIYLITRLFENM